MEFFLTFSCYKNLEIFRFKSFHDKNNFERTRLKINRYFTQL